MAEVLTVVALVANKLSAFVTEEGRVLTGLTQDIHLISDEFGHMQAFLQKMAEESDQEDDPQLKEWIRQVREAAYDVEDVLDQFVFLLPRYPRRRNLINFLKNLPARHRLAAKLQGIKARIRNISEARLRYESNYGKILTQVPAGRLAGSSPWRWRQSKDDDALLAEEVQLVGLEKPKHNLLSRLLDFEGGSQLKVTAVLGMGGVGKTTIVKKVHDDAHVKSHFQIRAWITVSQTGDLQELLKSLIRQLQASFRKPVLPPMESVDIYQLKTLVKGFLRRARYLIVFDDVWDTEFWNAFKYVLPENSYGGNCVMLTTRMADVASASCIESHDHVYRMECLTYQDSLTLFCRKTFKDSCPPAHLANVVKSIVEKCRGLPLAIVAISGVFASKNQNKLDEWERFRRRLGDESEGTGNLESAKRILCLSYSDLPFTLKTCLLYTSIYPEDYKIPCYHLIGLWIAERFVEHRAGLTAEEVAWDHLKELANRNLIQVSEVLYDGLPRFFYIHDLLREVIVAESREQNMMSRISNIQQTGTMWLPGKVVRRLILNDNVHDNTTKERQHCFDNLRSIITFGRTEPLSKALLSELLSNKLLKVLDFGCVDLEEIPGEIFKLIHLTYLGLCGTRVKVVPKTIRGLRNLEYLDLRGTNVRILPVEILKLSQLRHLLVHQQVDFLDRDLGYHGFKAPYKLGELLELQTLDNIDAADSDKTRMFHEIGKLIQLRMLGITNLRREDGRELCSSLEKLTNLRELAIASSIEEKYEVILDLNHSLSASSLQSLCWLSLRGRLEKVPNWIKDLKGLGRINLMLSSLSDDPLESLQHLPNLIELCLIQAYTGESMCFKAGGFPKLNKLYMRNMKGLKWIRVEAGSMAFIKRLILEQVPLLEELPIGIENLSQLQMLELWAMSSQLTKKLESEGYKKTEHIPQVLIDGLQIGGRWNEHNSSRKNAAQNSHILNDAPVVVGRGSGFVLFEFAEQQVANAFRHSSSHLFLLLLASFIVLHLLFRILSSLAKKS